MPLPTENNKALGKDVIIKIEGLLHIVLLHEGEDVKKATDELLEIAAQQPNFIYTIISMKLQEMAMRGTEVNTLSLILTRALSSRILFDDLLGKKDAPDTKKDI